MKLLFHHNHVKQFYHVTSKQQLYTFKSIDAHHKCKCFPREFMNASHHCILKSWVSLLITHFSTIKSEMDTPANNDAGYVDEFEFDLNKKGYAWDDILLFIYSFLMLIGGTISNGIVVFLTRKHDTFHEGYMYIRAAYAVVDIIFIWGVAPLVMAFIVLDHVPERLICYIGDVGIGRV